MMRPIARVALITMLVAACGSASTGVSKTAASRLHAQITLLRASSTSNRTAARVALERVRTEITQLRAQGELRAAAVRRLRAAANAVERQLSLLPEPTTTTTTAPSGEGKNPGKSGEEHGTRSKEND